MLVKNTRFKIEIYAMPNAEREYVVEVTGRGLDDEQYAIGPNNSVSNLVARICNRLEVDVPADSP